jgi:DNA-binding NarL/FixJ family response regulator
MPDWRVLHGRSRLYSDLGAPGQLTPVRGRPHANFGSKDRKAGSEQEPIETLTAREEQILVLLGKGLRNKEIARQLDLKEKTVKHYVTNILQKLQLRNRVEAAVLLQKQSKPERVPE